MISLVGDTQDEFDTTVGTELTEGEGEDESEGDDVIGDFENVDDDIGLEGDQVESLFPHLSFVCSYLSLFPYYLQQPRQERATAIFIFPS